MVRSQFTQSAARVARSNTPLLTTEHFTSEGRDTPMAAKSHGQLSGMELDAIATIRKLRATHFTGPRCGRSERAAEIMHELLCEYHGNVKIRLGVISVALGCTMRTLEREFIAQYAETMNRFHQKARLDYAEMQISCDPNIKLTAIAAELGYDRQSEFNRFFHRKRGESPRQFASRMRKRQ
jgi:AraC-like DNA-binding protein